MAKLKNYVTTGTRSCPRADKRGRVWDRITQLKSMDLRAKNKRNAYLQARRKYKKGRGCILHVHVEEV